MATTTQDEVRNPSARVDALETKDNQSSAGSSVTPDPWAMSWNRAARGRSEVQKQPVARKTDSGRWEAKKDPLSLWEDSLDGVGVLFWSEPMKMSRNSYQLISFAGWRRMFSLGREDIW